MSLKPTPSFFTTCSMSESPTPDLQTHISCFRTPRARCSGACGLPLRARVVRRLRRFGVQPLAQAATRMRVNPPGAVSADTAGLGKWEIRSTGWVGCEVRHDQVSGRDPSVLVLKERLWVEPRRHYADVDADTSANQRMRRLLCARRPDQTVIGSLREGWIFAIASQVTEANAFEDSIANLRGIVDIPAAFLCPRLRYGVGPRLPVRV
ncbi:hypothetical protein IF2G_07009 [Cordyceps javanica]|nr:hypothetical protein IF2G_07009 [Cordyceps javanica]